jgi:hypothetical protein
MANIRLRSPYYIYKTEASAVKATLDLSINGTVEYTITKTPDSGGNALFEISELARDFIDVNFYGTYLPITLDIVSTIKFYNSNDTVIRTFVETDYGFDGYGDFKDGSNPKILSNALLQSNTEIYLPENTTGKVATESNNDIIYNTILSNAVGNVTVGNHTIKVNRICEPKYSPIKITFVNKFGVLQDLWFFKKMVQSINVQKDSFKRNILTSSGQYSVFKHSQTVLNTTANELFTSNTGFVSESMNETFKQLMLSERVWATIEGIVYPIAVTNSQLQYKTSLNDKLINYTIEFEYAYDAINTIR